MAFSDPFAFDGNEYDGEELRHLVYALAGGLDGVVGDSTSLAVSAQTSPNNTVKVAAGDAIVLATASGEGGAYHQHNDASLNSPTISSTAAQVRTDRLVLRITAGVAALEIIAGTPGSSTPPAVTGDNVIPLARIELPVSTTNITNAMIVDEREWIGGWTSYSPTIRNHGNAAVSATVNYAKYVKFGRTVHAKVYITVSATSAGSGAIVVDLPFNGTQSDIPLGTITYYDQSATTEHHGAANLNTSAATHGAHLVEGGGARAAMTTQLDAGDIVTFDVTYESTT